VQIVCTELTSKLGSKCGQYRRQKCIYALDKYISVLKRISLNAEEQWAQIHLRHQQKYGRPSLHRGICSTAAVGTALLYGTAAVGTALLYGTTHNTYNKI
jgi:hypothetical protein